MSILLTVYLSGLSSHLREQDRFNSGKGTSTFKSLGLWETLKKGHQAQDQGNRGHASMHISMLGK